jgi:hypothetical protein
MTMVLVQGLLLGMAGVLCVAVWLMVKNASGRSAPAVRPAQGTEWEYAEEEAYQGRSR